MSTDLFQPIRRKNLPGEEVSGGEETEETMVEAETEELMDELETEDWEVEQMEVSEHLAQSIRN